MTRRRVVLLLVVLLLLIAPVTVQGQAAFVSRVETLDVGGVATTLVFSSVNGGGGTAVIAIISYRDNGEVVTGVTYGANAMARVSGVFPFSALEFKYEAWYILSQAGTQNVTATWDVAPPRMYGTVMVVSGVDTGTPFGTVLTQSGTATGTTDLTPTTVVNGLVISAIHIRDDPDVTPDGTQVERSQQTFSGLDTHETSTLLATGTSTTVGGTWSGSIDYLHIAIPIRPAAGAAGCTGGLLLRGIGKC